METNLENPCLCYHQNYLLCHKGVNLVSTLSAASSPQRPHANVMSWHWFCKHLVPVRILSDSQKPWQWFSPLLREKNRCMIWQSELLLSVSEAAASRAWLTRVTEIESRTRRRRWIHWCVWAPGGFDLSLGEYAASVGHAPAVSHLSSELKWPSTPHETLYFPCWGNNTKFAKVLDGYFTPHRTPLKWKYVDGCCQKRQEFTMMLTTGEYSKPSERHYFRPQKINSQIIKQEFK